MTTQNNDQRVVSPFKDPGILILWVIVVAIIFSAITLSVSYLINFWNEDLAYKFYYPIIRLIKLINENWKAFLVILIPLFYREIADLISISAGLPYSPGYPQKEATTSVLEEVK